MRNSEQTCDVLVVGGGAAGIGAAVGAARAGARVVVLEKYGFPGGIAAAGMIGTVCGLFLRNTKGQIKPVAGGFVHEFGERLAARQFEIPRAVANGLYILPCEPWHMIRLADRFLAHPAIGVFLHSQAGSVRMQGKAVAEVECLCWHTRVTVRAGCVVDCTGEATVVQLAGGRTTTDASQHGAVLFRVDGLPVRRQGERLAMLRKIVHAAAKEGVRPECGNISLVPARLDSGDCLFSVPIAPAGGIHGMTDMEQSGRELVEDVLKILRTESYISDTTVPATAVQVGTRTGRRAVGRQTLTREQVLGCVKSRDGVARGCWPIEEWRGGRRPELQWLPEDDYYDIPAGCLVAADLDNVFMAGRCMSAEEGAMGSARVVGTALGTGYGAGTLAAFQALGKSRDEAVKTIRAAQQG